MEIFWYLVAAAVVTWGIFFLVKKDRAGGLEKDWDKKFLTDLEEWKKENRV